MSRFKSQSRYDPYSSNHQEASSNGVSWCEVDPTVTRPASSEDNLSLYQDIQLPSHAASQSGQQGSGVRNLTHPSELGKRYGKRTRKGADNKAVRKRRRKFDDQPDVFDHLATLRRKQSAQLKHWDSQEVPVSPQFLPGSSEHHQHHLLSLHSSFSPTSKPTSLPDHPQARRVFFAAEQTYWEDDSEGMYPTHLPLPEGEEEEEEEEEGEVEVTRSYPQPLPDHTLEREDPVQLAEVPTLGPGGGSELRARVTSPPPFLRAQVTSPPSFLTARSVPTAAAAPSCSEAGPQPHHFNILHYYPREE